MAKLSTDALLDAFKEMTLLELSEFVKVFEETFDVTAAAPAAVAVAAPAGGAGGDAAADPPRPPTHPPPQASKLLRPRKGYEPCIHFPLKTSARGRQAGSLHCVTKHKSATLLNEEGDH